MGSTDPRGEGDVKGWAKGHNPGYEAMLEEYRRKIRQAENIKEDIAAGAKIDPASIIMHAVPLIMKWLPKFADGLQKSAEQVRTLTAVMDGMNPVKSDARPNVPLPVTELDLLAAKFGADLTLDCRGVTFTEMEAARLRWTEELKQYEVRGGIPHWPYRSSPEFVPHPESGVMGRWIRNPHYAKLHDGPARGTAVPRKSGTFHWDAKNRVKTYADGSTETVPHAEPEGASDGGRTEGTGTEAGEG